MKKNPIAIDPVDFVTVDVRAHPHTDLGVVNRELPVSVDGSVTLDGEGNHFALLTISQDNKEYSYTFEVTAAARFQIDVAGTREGLGNSFNPSSVACIVGRALYAAAMEMLRTVSSRGPWGTASCPDVLVGPADMGLDFDGDRDQILREYFGFNDKALALLTKEIEKSEKPKHKSKPRKPRKAAR